MCSQSTPAPVVPPTQVASPVRHHPTRPSPRVAECPRCGGRGFIVRAYSDFDCPECDGWGEIEVFDVSTCDWCGAQTTYALTLVRDWAGHQDAICPDCLAAAEADPAGHDDVVVVEAVAA